MNSSSSLGRILPRRPFNNSRTALPCPPLHDARNRSRCSCRINLVRAPPRARWTCTDPSPEGGERTKVRYLVFFMMFIAVVINYMDRANFTVSVPLIEKQFGFDITQMGRISFIWGLAYALFNFPGGWFADKLGIRKAASFALGWWSIFTILSAVAYSMVSWCVIRGLMGAGEAPIWPINAKATSTWSAPSERAAPSRWPVRGSLSVRRLGCLLRDGLFTGSVGNGPSSSSARWVFSGFQSGFSSSATLRNRTPGSTSANSASSRASAARPPRRKKKRT